MITGTGLLKDVDRLSPAGRVARVVEVARGLQASPRELRSLLTDLEGGDPHARHLAVVMAGATGQGDFLARAVQDGNRWVCVAAVHAPGLPDQALLDVIASGSKAMRQQVYRRLRREGREDLAGRALPQVRARWGDHEAAALLVACDAATVGTALPDLGYAVTGWMSLAARHPEVLARHAVADLDGRDGYRAQLWWQEQEGLVRALLEVRPDVVLDLAERGPTGPLAPVLLAGLGPLLRVDAGRTAALLLADPQRGRQLGAARLTRRQCKRLARLPEEVLGALLRATHADPRVMPRVLRALPPSRRSAVFDLAQHGDLSTTVIPDDQLSLLPWRRRHVEARRMLALPEIARSPQATWRCTAFLPPAEAVPVLEAVVASADADERAAGYALLVGNAAMAADAGRVTELLAWLLRARNERDPVRQAVLGAVAQLPHELVTAAAVPSLDRLVKDALDARDTSRVTIAAAAQLAFRVLWQSVGRDGEQALADWALATVERLGAWNAHAMTPGIRLDRALRRGQEHAVWGYLAGPVQRALDRGDAWPLLRVARRLGRRAHHLPDLQDLLGQATLVPHDGMIREAVALWLDPPGTRSERVGQLVAVDASMVRIPEVLRTLASTRTDLLERHVLAGRPLSGRFASRSVWVPPMSRGDQWRWTPRQRVLYRRLLRVGIHDEGAGLWNRAWCARALPCSPDVTSADLQDLLQSDDVPLVEGVLTGLGDTDRPAEALPLLLEHVGTDRARVAVYAASRCARWAAPDGVADLLAGLLRTAPKVVVRKEAARLVAEVRPERALDLLLEAAGRPDAHRDVRVAALTSLGGFVDRPGVDAVLAAAAEDGDEHVAGALLAIPWHRVPPAARPRLGELVATVARHPHGTTAQRALDLLPGWSPWLPDAAGPLQQALADLDRLDIWASAAAAAAHPAVWSGSPELPAALAEVLLDRVPEGPDATPTRDLPAARRLQRLLDLLQHHPVQLRSFPQAAVLLADLLVRREHPVDAARLHLLLAAPGAAAGSHLPLVADLLAGRPVAAARVAHELPDGDWSAPGSLALATALAGRDGATGGFLALAVAAAAGRLTQWQEPWADLLRGLRRHPDPDVREAAAAVATAPE